MKTDDYNVQVYKVWKDLLYLVAAELTFETVRNM